MVENKVQEKIQQLELDTVKAVTEMKVDIRNLTFEVKRLNDTIARMTDNYVTKEKHNEDLIELQVKIDYIKRAGIRDKIVTGVITAVIVGIVMYEVGKFFE